MIKNICESITEYFIHSENKNLAFLSDSIRYPSISLLLKQDCQNIRESKSRPECLVCSLILTYTVSKRT